MRFAVGEAAETAWRSCAATRHPRPPFSGTDEWSLVPRTWSWKTRVALSDAVIALAAAGGTFRAIGVYRNAGKQREAHATITGTFKCR
jgi:hypothetical protein